MQTSYSLLSMRGVLSVIIIGCILSSCSSDVVVPRTTGTIVGKVKDPTGQRALEGVQISTAPGTSSQLTKSDGTFQLDDVIPDNYLLKAYYADTSYVASANVPVNVRAGSTTSADLILKYGSTSMGCLQGTVIDSSGNPISGALVTTTPRTAAVITDKAGAFMLYDMPPSVYKIYASRDDLYASAQIDMQRSVYERVRLVVSPNDDIHGRLSGKVIFNDLPVQGAIVKIEGADLVDTTNANGEYLIRNIVPGSYTLRCSNDGFQSVRTAVNILPGYETRQDIALREGLDISENDLELYLTFNSNYADQSPHQRAMQFVAGAYGPDRFGNVGGALECFGTGGVATSSVTGLDHFPITIGAWFKIPSGNIDHMLLLGKYDPARDEGYSIYVENNRLIFYYAIEAQGQFDYGYWKFEFAQFPRDEWFWVGYSTSAQGVGFATINGEMKTDGSWQKYFDRAATTNTPLRIGSVDDTNGWQGLRGMIDHVVIYSRSMTFDEFRKNMENGD